MSCFICSNNHLLLIATASFTEFAVYGNSTTITGSITKDILPLVNKLQLMNVRAYRENYNGRYKVEFIPIRKASMKTLEKLFTEPKLKIPNLALYIIKQIQCYQYQAADSTAWDNSKLEQLTNDLIVKMVNVYTSENELYNSMPWGIL